MDQEEHVQALWIGVDISEDIRPGTYLGTIMIGPAGGDKQAVTVDLNIKNEVLADRGDAEPWRHSRLRWLNSTAGLDDDPVAPYGSLNQTENGVLEVSGKAITAGNAVLPSSIMTAETEVLNRSIEFTVQGDLGEEQFSAPEYRMW
jgi:hypothetical protein